MTALLIWPLVETEAPRLITSDYQVIDLLESNPVSWQQYISPENKHRVLEQIHRWNIAVEAGADAIDAYSYAVDGNGYDFSNWLLQQENNYPECYLLTYSVIS